MIYVISQLENYLKKHFTSFILLKIFQHYIFIYYAFTFSYLVYFYPKQM